MFGSEEGALDGPYPPQKLRPRHSDTLSNTRHFTLTASLVLLVLTRHSTQGTLYSTLPRRIFTSASRGGCRGKVAPKNSQRRKYPPPSPTRSPAHPPSATKPSPVFFQRAPARVRWNKHSRRLKTPPLLRYGGDKQVGEGTLLRLTPERLRRINTVPRVNMERAGERRGEEGRGR